MSLHATDTHHSNDERPSLVSRLIEWWLKGPPGHDIDRLRPSELEHMAHDLGLQPSELVRLAQRDAHAEILLYRRLQALGLAATDVERLGLKRDLERTCALCTEQEICRHDLDMRPDSDDWKNYCPNSGVLDAVEVGCTLREAAAQQTQPAAKPSCC
jgi:hypothetical protein